MGILGAGGVAVLSQLDIDAAKNWAGQDITNMGSLTATALHGTTYWGDVYLEDTECPACNRKFKVGDKIVFVSNKVEEKFVAAVPVHLACIGGQ